MNSTEAGLSPNIFPKGDMNFYVAACPDISGFVKDLMVFRKQCIQT